jgi:hypothetical protein
MTAQTHTALTLSVPDNFVRLERKKHETQFPRNWGARARARTHTHTQNTALTRTLAENPNLHPYGTAVNTKQKHFLEHKRTQTQWNNTALIPALPDTPNLCPSRTELRTQHQRFLQHRHRLTQQVDSTNTNTISHHNPLSVCNGDYYTTLPLPPHIKPLSTVKTRQISTLHNTTPPLMHWKTLNSGLGRGEMNAPSATHNREWKLLPPYFTTFFSSTWSLRVSFPTFQTKVVPSPSSV